MKQKSARIKKIMAVFCCMVMAMAIAGCQRTDKSSPKGLTEVYLEKMKEGKYKEACDTVGAEFDQKSYDKSASLQKELMKLTYANMTYEVNEEKIKDDKATVSVKVKNFNYIDTMNDAIYETMKQKKDDEFTKSEFTKKMKKAKQKEETVLVNYRKENKKWIFDGSNSLLNAAMLGYLIKLFRNDINFCIFILFLYMFHS